MPDASYNPALCRVPREGKVPLALGRSKLGHTASRRVKSFPADICF